MSQILNLFRVPAAHFEQIQQANHWESVTTVATGEIGFQGSEPAIEYLLSKAGVAEEFASALFYPSVELTQGQYIHDIDFDAMDEDKLFEYYSNALMYTSPETVSLLWRKIQPISVEQISAIYNSLELREKNLGSWHDNESENQAYNRRHITQDYQTLREFYEAASHAGEYVFCLGV
jgi:hypothetical protein